MTPSLTRTWSLRVACALAVLGICVVLYVKTQAVDYAAHADFVDSLRRVQQLHAVMKQQTLAARFGLLNQYDPLARTYAELSVVVHDLGARLARITYRNAEVDQAYLKLTTTHQRTQADFEHFKSQNSILKNSLYYLPMAGEVLVGKLAEAGTAESLAAVAPANSLVQALLAHNMLQSESLEQRIARRFTELEDRAKTLPAELQGDLDLVLQHGRTVMRQQALVNPLLTRVTSAELDRAALRLTSLYGARLGHAIDSANRYRIALYVLMLLLLLGVVAIGFKLRALYANLEKLVLDRTARLDTALRELWGEMALAKKIQTALVPRNPRLRSCDVAGAMQSADDVGGDYYDVLTINDKEWVLIGDVSGHGVPAGLVMMMCQTAVRAALQSNPDMMPDELLSIVNTTLIENIRRLGEDKYMTITALCRTTDGRFHFAGLHQDILIYRRATGQVEILAATGTCLGLSDTIAHQLPVGEFELAVGDVLLLHTDGVTEATRDGSMLDSMGVQRLLRELGTQSAQEIVSGIQACLADYIVSDDVTALAIKQC